MGHTFPAEQMEDDERRRRAADWIETGIADLARAADLLDGRNAGGLVRSLITSANQTAKAVRDNPDAVSPTPTPDVEVRA